MYPAASRSTIASMNSGPLPVTNFLCQKICIHNEARAYVQHRIFAGENGLAISIYDHFIIDSFMKG